MQKSLYDQDAKRKTVSVTLNADLVARSAAHGLNISRIAEAALIAAFQEAESAKIREELREDAQWVSDLIATHGHPFPDSHGAFAAQDDAA